MTNRKEFYMRLRDDTKMYLFVLVAFIAGFILAMAVFAPTAQAQDKILLCHATGSTTNPYVLIEVDESALNGHMKKNGQLHGDKLGNQDFIIEEGDCPQPEAQLPPIEVVGTCDGVTIKNIGSIATQIGYGAGEGTRYATIEPGQVIAFTGELYWAVWYALPNDGYEIIAEGDFYECPPPTTIPGTCHECGTDTTAPPTTTTSSEEATTTTEGSTTTTTRAVSSSTVQDSTTTTKPTPPTTVTELPYTGPIGLLALIFAGSALVGGGITVLRRNRA